MTLSPDNKVGRFNQILSSESLLNLMLFADGSVYSYERLDIGREEKSDAKIDDIKGNMAKMNAPYRDRTCDLGVISTTL